MSNLELIPVWKGGASLTAADRLHEIALVAQKYPERFERFVMARLGKSEEGRMTLDTYEFGCDLAQQIGLFDLGKDQALQESKV